MSQALDRNVELLRKVTLFADLAPEDVASLAFGATPVSLDEGEYLFHQGDAGDRVYVVRSGFLETVLDEGLQTERVITSLGPAEVVGEMSLLTDEPRSASIRAAAPTHLLALSKERFHGVLLERPSAALQVSKVLSRRLSETNAQLSVSRGVIGVIIADDSPTTRDSYIVPLVESIGRQAGRPAVLVPLALHPVADAPAGQATDPEIWIDTATFVPGSRHCLTIDPEPVESLENGTILAGLADLRRRHGHVVVWIPPRAIARFAPLIARADRVAALATTDESVRALPAVVGQIARCGAEDVRVAVVGSAPLRTATRPRSLLQPVRLSAGVGPIPTGLERLGRVLMKRSVGLALSGGAAQGLAHLGVMAALIRNGVPIDFIAGTSGGALYGSLVASGMGIERAEESVMRHARRNLYDRIDPGLPWSGLIRGRKIEHMIRDLLGEIAFEQLAIPLCPVAADLDTGEEVVLDHGLVHQAVRASISVPGVFEPYRLHGRLLVDGGAVNPLPVNVARRMGADFVVAVQVPAPGKVSDEPGKVITRRMGRKHSILSTVLRSYYFVGDALAGISAAEADVLIKPQVAQFGWRDYRSAPAIIQAGFEAGSEQFEQSGNRLDIQVWRDRNGALV